MPFQTQGLTVTGSLRSRPEPRLAARIVLELRREGFPLGKRDTLLQEVRKRSGKKELSLRSLDTALHKLRGLNLFD